ncbi:glucose-6-phosphate isomerase [Methanotorris igneus]|uniref:Probable glucose-6-phosphate isomerase n=1 Tax=Methanotorris igneus (strain DSM 5666 / JCM 11834 / Kol 5) TaxID=880724 RepID=F6BC59_METIK|nr:glucose-6-phosphate isomerase [Methanotorris igneus]AEF97265.1 Glucose-6-phosphate isomerase [Methanotorris igneus Kol 5]
MIMQWTDVLGAEGVSTKDIENMGNEIENARMGFMEKIKNGEIGFTNLLNVDLGNYDEIKKYMEEFDYILIIGMGGSILGTEAIHEGINGLYYNEHGFPKVYFLDNSDPEKTCRVLNLIDLEKTLIFVVSKSGNTLETLANFSIIKNILEKKVKNYEKNIIAITNGGYLKKLAEKGGYILFNIPENVSGRYSVFSDVGLAPLSCLGINIKELISGAKIMDKLCKKEDVFENPALMSATIHYLMYKKRKNISVIMPYAERLYKFGMWYRQLWAESLGKDGIGQTPLVSLGAKDQHSLLQLYMDGPKDKIVTFIRVNTFSEDIKTEYGEGNLNMHNLSEIINSEQLATEMSLTNHKVPNVKIILEELNETTLGMLLYMYEMQTAFSGELFGVNSFDQPAVEEEKKLTWRLLEEGNYGNKRISK